MNKKEIKKKKNEIKTTKKTLIKISCLWMIVFISAFFYHKVEKNKNNPKIIFTKDEKIIPKKMDKIYIFYPKNKNLINAEIEIPEIKTSNDLVNGTILEVINKLETIGFIPELEKNLISYYIVNKILYLDFPDNMFNYVENGKSELLIIYSFVNSLTNIDGIESVRFLINHKEIEKIKYANLSKNYIYNKNI